MYINSAGARNPDEKNETKIMSAIRSEIQDEVFERGSWYYVRIVRVWFGSRPGTPDVSEPIVTFDKAFSSSDHAKAHLTTKMHKAILKAISKSHHTFNQ